MKINNWTKLSRLGFNGRKQLRRQKLSNNDVVAPEEEEEDEGILKSSIPCIFRSLYSVYCTN